MTPVDPTPPRGTHPEPRRDIPLTLSAAALIVSAIAVVLSVVALVD